MPSAKLLFSIVIPAYNYAHVLPRAVRSAYEQRGDDFEVIVINDGSTDNTHDTLCALEREMPQLRVHHQENTGLAGVRNNGTKISHGAYIIFLDADDELLPNALNIFRESIKKHPDAGMHIAPTIAVFTDGREKEGSAPKLANSNEQRFLDYLHKRLSLANGAVAMHRELFSKLQYPSLRQTEDIPVFAAALATKSAVAVEQATTKIYKHANSMRHDIDASLKIGNQLVTEIFDRDTIPEHFQKYRKSYAARRAMSMFRICYKNREFELAKKYFQQALLANPRELLRKPSNLLKYFRCFAK